MLADVDFGKWIKWSDASVQAAVISAGAVLLSGLLTLAISAYFSRRGLLDERAQRNEEWERERRRTDDEWLREKVIGYYSDALYYLIKLNLSADSKEKNRDKQVRQHVAESQRYLNLLGIYRTEYSVGLRS